MFGLHPDDAVNQRKREKRLLRAIHLIKNEWGKTVPEVLAWLDDDARWSDPGFADVADDPAAHLVDAALGTVATPPSSYPGPWGTGGTSDGTNGRGGR